MRSCHEIVSLRACLLLLGLAVIPSAFAQPTPAARTTVMISDTHMGLGRDADGKWDSTEDFRWPEALEGFLSHVSASYGDSVDLVILGDFLELWQLPEGESCASATGDLGCTPEELAKLAARVIAAHTRELTALAQFSARGNNQLILIPGNHDAGMLLPEVWEQLEGPLGVSSGRVTLAADGVWISADERVYAEHGHQIGADANRYSQWPIITGKRGDRLFVQRPWGEQFVQSIFNGVERQYAMIDNLSPESAGVRYRIADRGYVAAAADVARFMIFNLFETSLKQKAQILGDECASDEERCEDAGGRQWDLDYARTHGWRLPAAGLEKDDPFRRLLEDESAQSRSVREELDRRVRSHEEADSLTAEELTQLCDHAAIQGDRLCERPKLGALKEAALYTKEAVLLKHLRDRDVLGKGATFFVYGHTHQLETPWPLEVESNRFIEVANTGAFQRLVDEPGFKRRMKQYGLTPQNALRELTHDQLAACYTYVAVTREDRPRMETLRWYQEDGADGISVPVSDSRCE